MGERLLVVLDVGKSVTKLSLWSEDGRIIAKATRANRGGRAGGLHVLDVEGIDDWLADRLRDFAARGRIEAIVPVAHGAAAAIVRGGRLVHPPLDYEEPVPPDLRAAYEAMRDPFAETGSPALPGGLNLGVQLYHLQCRDPELLSGGAQILPWAQFWSWRLSGVARSEVTSLGCHTDLWHPAAGRFSDLARHYGWADRFAPPAPAAEVLGTLTPEWVRRTGLSPEVKVHCGIHDSNAALAAAGAFAEVAGEDFSVLSTGTWFIAMRAAAPDSEIDLTPLDERRDCLVNVAPSGRCVPSSRFMGGREIQILSGVGAPALDFEPDQAMLLAAAADVVAKGRYVLPTFAAGFGPYPDRQGRWIGEPAEPITRRSAIALYAALLAEVSLGLIGARGSIIVEGRFARAEVFVRALASLSCAERVYVPGAQLDASYGALRMMMPDLGPPGLLDEVRPLEIDLADYRRRWRHEVEEREPAQ